jgi:polysaccharide export outer membrane protein
MVTKGWFFLVGVCFWVALALPGIAGASGVAEDGYRIGAGDVLSISVWKNADLTRVVQVLPDGRISFPLLGQIMVEDITVAQLTSTLEEKISRFSPEPQISVEVQQVNSQVVYVLGRVNRPGHFVLDRNINVLQALAMAGGLTPFAKRREIKVFRAEKAETVVYPFDYDAVTENSALGQNIRLKRGDIIVAP